MNIAFILDRPELCGGVKVVFQYAELLHREDHSVSVLAKGAKPSWCSYRGQYYDLTIERPVQRFDLVVTTFWTTVAVAEELALGPIVHYCQGFEGFEPYSKEHWPNIEHTYQKRYPAWCVSNFLQEFLDQRFQKPAFVLPPPLDSIFCIDLNSNTCFRSIVPESPNILVSGIFEASVKGIEIALNIAKQLSERNLMFNLTRLSLIEQSDDERQLYEADAFIQSIPPHEVAKLLTKTDLVLFTSRKEEGFGLTMLEAMASGVPIVMTDIPSARELVKNRLPLFALNDTKAMTNHAYDLLTDESLRSTHINTGLKIANEFSESAMYPRLVSAIEWAINNSEQH